MSRDICSILKESKSITVLGISDKPDRDSGSIAIFLKNKGYSVTGVHPQINHVEDIPVYPSLKDIPVKVDILDVFLNGDRLNALQAEILSLKPKTVWFQLGVHNDHVAGVLTENGIEVIQDHCIAVEYRHCSFSNNL